MCVAGGSVGVRSGTITTPGRNSMRRNGPRSASTGWWRRARPASGPSSPNTVRKWRMGGAARTSPARQRASATAGSIHSPSASSPGTTVGCSARSSGQWRRKKRLSKRSGAKGGVSQRPAHTSCEASSARPRSRSAAASAAVPASRGRARAALAAVRSPATRPASGSAAGALSSSPVSSQSSRSAAAATPGTRSGPSSSPSTREPAGMATLVGSPARAPTKECVDSPAPSSAKDRRGSPRTGRSASPRANPPPGKACQPGMNGTASERRTQKTSIRPWRRRHGTTPADARGGFAGCSAAPAAAAAASACSYSPGDGAVSLTAAASVLAREQASPPVRPRRRPNPSRRLPRPAPPSPTRG